MVAKNGYTIMRPLIFDFADDTEALRQDTEYMFGPEYLVCPITEDNAETWKVYLPNNRNGWTDYHDGMHYDGGQYITIQTHREYIPVFIRK